MASRTTTTTQQFQQNQQETPVKERKNSGAPLRTRKSNGKSRGGCLVCKKRRIKCDELRPTCTRCKSQLHKCVYATNGVPRWKNNVTSFSLSKLAKAEEPKEEVVVIKGPSSSPDSYESVWDISSSASPPVTIQPQINFMSHEDCSKFDTQDALLLLHFSTNTMGSLVGAASLWGEVLQLAFQHDFLFHGVLALAARHIRKCPTVDSMSSGYDYDQLETHHLQKALSTYHPSLEALNPQNPEAVVSTSFILYFYMCSVMDFDPFAVIPVEDTSFKYLRGICSVITSGPDVRMKITLFRSLVAKPVHFPYWMEETYPVMGPASVLFNFLEDIPAYSHLLRIDNSRDVYRNRISSLAPYLVACTKPGLIEEAYEELLIGFKRWQANIPIELDLLVQAFDPMALVLLAHFYAAIGTVMSRMSTTWWWWQEKPGFMVNKIGQYLGPEWDVCMAWPKKMALSFKGAKSPQEQRNVSPFRVGMDFEVRKGMDFDLRKDMMGRDFDQLNYPRPFETWV